MPNDFGSTLRAYRTRQGLSLYRLAQLSGVDSGSLSRIERNLYRPGAQSLQQIAAALGVPYRELHAAAGYRTEELPALRPYLRAAYGMTELDAADVERYIREKYGPSTGPLDGEDEVEEAA